MNKIYFISTFLVFILFAFCKKTETNQAPAIESLEISSLVKNSVTFKAKVCSNGEKTTIVFEYGKTTEYGSVISAKENDITGSVDATADIADLELNTIYHFRAKATNSIGTTYSEDLSFTTSEINFNTALSYGTVTDVDGNIYRTIKIGNQIWMAENLKVTKYNDGTPISNIRDNTLWANATTGAFCWMYNDYSYRGTGALYNLPAIHSGKLAPAGWHVATDTDWNTLFTFLGGMSSATNKLKEAGIEHWSLNTNSTNESGFSAVGAGLRSMYGVFGRKNQSAYFWGAATSSSSFYYIISYNSADISSYNGNTASSLGASVRCVKN